MNVKELKGYMVLCKQTGVEPTFDGLKNYYKVRKGLSKLEQKIDGLDASYSPMRNEVYVTYKGDILFILQDEHLQGVPKDVLNDNNKLLPYVLNEHDDIIEDIISCFKEEG